MPDFSRVCLIGIDRIVASFALGLRRTGYRGAIVGVADSNTLNASWKQGVITDGKDEVAEAVRGADLIMISPDAGRQFETLNRVVEVCDPSATISDMTRVKGDVSRIFEDSGRHDVHYVGFRLLGENELSAPAKDATKFYFENKTVILTPRGKSDLDAFSILQNHLRKMGARVIAMSPQAHDQLLARVEQLPKLVVLEVLQQILGEVDPGQLSPEMLGDWFVTEIRQLPEMQKMGWAADVEANCDLVLTGIDALISALQNARTELKSRTFSRRFDDLVEQSIALTSQNTPKIEADLVVVSGGDVTVTQRVAEVLAEARIAIQRLDRMTNAENGTFRLTVKSTEDRDKAISLLRREGIEVAEVA